MAWVVLMASGLLEAGWALALKASEGFTRLWPSVWFVLLAGLSFLGLAYALRSLPVGVAYAVWTGIGAAVTATIGMAWLGEGVSTLKIVSILLVIAGIAGLQISTAEPAAAVVTTGE
ncbi:DMT family transporter [Georgenia satyanarayanai]|uniref:DMT family transporter n=1 Tax=Georgenia satyanarayanai TaxID=860221 RepID=UPI001263F53F|nr:multidrug efflux SMR transporter [Georgenia satyanarayanai]